MRLYLRWSASHHCCLRESSSARRCCCTRILVNLLFASDIRLHFYLVMCEMHSWALRTKPKFKPHTARLLRGKAEWVNWHHGYLRIHQCIYQITTRNFSRPIHAASRVCHCEQSMHKSLHCVINIIAKYLAMERYHTMDWLKTSRRISAAFVFFK